MVVSLILTEPPPVLQPPSTMTVFVGEEERRNDPRRDTRNRPAADHAIDHPACSDERPVGVRNHTIDEGDADPAQARVRVFPSSAIVAPLSSPATH